MKREEHLKFCKICEEQKFDPKQGIICGLTNQPADFEESCDSFKEDPKRKQYEAESEIYKKTVGKGARFVNNLIDGIPIAVLCNFIGSYFIESLVLESSNTYYENVLIYAYPLFIIISLIYYVTFETLTGRTLGKFITGTKVVDKNGEKPKFLTILIRTLCRFIPFEAFSFLGAGATGWHDQLSKTEVIENTTE